MRKRRVAVITAAAVVVAGVVAVTATGALGSLDLGSGSAAPAVTATPTAAGTPSAARSSAPPAQPITALDPVLEAVDGGRPVDPDKLAARIEAVDDIGGTVGAAVLGADSSKPLYRSNARSALIPASTNKVLTAAAALKLLGPTHRFSTSVVADGAKGIVLVGGGDPYLAADRADVVDPGQASLQDLAARTAKQLKKDDRTTVRLGYDTSLFSGTDWNPRWPDAYRDYVTPTTALWANEGRLGGSVGPRQKDPARAATEVFAGHLKSYGIKVAGIAEDTAGDDAEQIAGVESLSLERIVERLLMVSDNDAAEIVARQVAVAAGRPGSIDDASRAIRTTLDEMGAWDDVSRSYDGSGLARQTKVTAETLARVVRLAVSGDEPSLAPVLTGLPVAGVEGSLRYRFDTTGAGGGRGLVHAKTGTLREVRSLAGYTYTADGELLAYAFVVNGVPNDFTALTYLDRVVAAVATCGCRA